MQREWPWMQQWSEPTAADLCVASAQLGRDLAGRVLAIGRRCRFDQPQVLVTCPLIEAEQEDGQAVLLMPFPTLFWLTCPHIREGVGALENAGMIAAMRDRVHEDPELRQEYTAANRDYARRREAILDQAMPGWRERVSPDMVRVITSSGIGGMVDPLGVKCVHMHVGHWLATGDNPVGREAVERMCAPGGRGLECEDGRCLPAREKCSLR